MKAEGLLDGTGGAVIETVGRAAGDMPLQASRLRRKSRRVSLCPPLSRAAAVALTKRDRLKRTATSSICSTSLGEDPALDSPLTSGWSGSKKDESSSKTAHIASKPPLERKFVCQSDTSCWSKYSYPLREWTWAGTGVGTGTESPSFSRSGAAAAAALLVVCLALVPALLLGCRRASIICRLYSRRAALIEPLDPSLRALPVELTEEEWERSRSVTDGAARLSQEVMREWEEGRREIRPHISSTKTR